MKVEIVRLPDIHSYKHLPAEFNSYGRFGRTRMGNFFVLPITASHPDNTELGGYFASSIHKDTLYLSPRGAALDFDIFVQEVIENGWIADIAKAAGLSKS